MPILPPPEADEVLRAFCAVDISEGIRSGLFDLQQRLRDTGARVGWVAPDNIHLTLVFLGDVFGAQVRPLSELLDAVARTTPPFSMEVAGTGFFGSPRSPRVLWVGVRDSPVLQQLQHALAQSVRAFGIPLENRPFRPHLTLGRVRPGAPSHELTSVLSSANNTAFGTVLVDRLWLMRSRLKHQGVDHSVLHESQLKGD